MMDFSSRHMMIPPESIKKEILEDSSQEALLSIQKVPSLSDLSKENSLEFKSVTRAQRRVRTEWNVDPPTSKSIHQSVRALRDGTVISRTGMYP
ncbi:hypothetical protein TNCV_1329521 [Trichonephila clavipes]|nr:hypothetical protein TNCV_1329521 [Trichonephila clavipes]